MINYESYEVSKARIEHGDSSWKGFDKVDNYKVDDKMGKMLENNFTYHSPIEDQPNRYVKIREEAKALAFTIVRNTPPSREQSLAITNLEQAIFWANAAIARNE